VKPPATARIARPSRIPATPAATPAGSPSAAPTATAAPPAAPARAVQLDPVGREVPPPLTAVAAGLLGVAGVSVLLAARRRQPRPPVAPAPD
jgi:hypothetical protein